MLLGISVGLISIKFSPISSHKKRATNEKCLFSKNEQENPRSFDNDLIFLKRQFASYYFAHLSDNIGYNSNGTCVYVAAGMIMSFWDTYWDDSIINESYESSPGIVDDYHSFLETTSPGIINDDIWQTYQYNMSYSSFIENYYQYYFHLLLLKLGKTDFGYYNYDLDYLNTIELLRYYIFDYKNYGAGNVALRYGASSVKNDVIYYVTRGIPVVLGIEKSDGTDAHAVVAYDYDSNTNNLYCHFGYINGPTHATPESQGYTTYLDYVAYDFLNTHTHTNNYKDSTNNSICPCSLVHITDVVVENMYLDSPPLFKWVSFYDEKWYRYQNLYFVLSILDMNNNVVREISPVNDTQYSFSYDDFSDAVTIPGNSFKLCIEISSNSYPYWDDYAVTTTFNEPNSYLHKTQIKPNQWGFESRYYFLNEGIRTTTYYSGNVTINTSRLRCGYIENSYVVLSARRENAGTAYLELNFNVPIYSYLASVCLWSNNENIDGSCLVKSKDSNGNWTTDINLLTDCVLPTKANGPLRIPLIHNQPVYGIRFEVTASALGDRNKGRLCIDDVVLSTESGMFNNLYYILNYSKTN